MKHFIVGKTETTDLLSELYEFYENRPYYTMEINPWERYIEIKHAKKDDEKTVVARITVTNVYDGYAVMKELEKEAK